MQIPQPPHQIGGGVSLACTRRETGPKLGKVVIWVGRLHAAKRYRLKGRNQRLDHTPGRAPLQRFRRVIVAPQLDDGDRLVASAFVQCAAFSLRNSMRHSRSAALLPPAVSTSDITGPVSILPSLVHAPCSSKKGHTGRMWSPSLKMISHLSSAFLSETSPVWGGRSAYRQERFVCDRITRAEIGCRRRTHRGVLELPPRAKASGWTSQISRSRIPPDTQPVR